MDTLGKSIAIILVCILLFLLPVQYDAMLQGNMVQSIKEDEFYAFVESVVSGGEMKKLEYQLFMNMYDSFDELGHMEIEVATIHTNGEQTYLLTEYYDALEEWFTHQDTLIFSKGDYITVRLVTDADSALIKLQEILLHKARKQEEIRYGGVIH